MLGFIARIRSALLTIRKTEPSSARPKMLCRGGNFWRFLKSRAYPAKRPSARLGIAGDEKGENGSLEGLQYVIDYLFVRQIPQ
jgi:hypothetical protein